MSVSECLARHNLVRVRRIDGRRRRCAGADPRVVRKKRLPEADGINGRNRDSPGKNENVAFGELTPTQF